jgi:alanine-synthesizing transaminase
MTKSVALDTLRVDSMPPYPLGAQAQAVMAARLEGRDIIDLSQINPDIAPPAEGVDKLVESVLRLHNHRYSASQGINRLRQALCDLYARKFGVHVDLDSECVAVMGAKEGLAHLLLAALNPGDQILIPSPCYPVHPAAASIAGAGCIKVPLCEGEECHSELLDHSSDGFFGRLEQRCANSWPQPRALLLSFPHNPTTISVDLSFFERLVAFAKEADLFLIHDFAYADVVFDGYKAPSLLEVPGAKDCSVELYSLSKAYGVPGWRVGFCVGNERLVSALKKIKSYMDFGIFQPIQISAAHLLEQGDGICQENAQMYAARRDVLVEGLKSIGWEVFKPKATVFVWAKIPKNHVEQGSMAFAQSLLSEADVAVCPGVGFGSAAEGYVRLALMEDEVRIRSAVRRLASVTS